MSPYTRGQKVRKPCSSPTCKRRVHTYVWVENPRCQPCRRRMRALAKARIVALEANALRRITTLVHELEELIAA